MSTSRDPVDDALTSLARNTLDAAPRPAPLAVVAILAERRRAEEKSRRLAALVAGASALPLVVLAAGSVLRVGQPGAGVLPAALVAVALAPAVAGFARLALLQRVY